MNIIAGCTRDTVLPVSSWLAQAASMSSRKGVRRAAVASMEVSMSASGVEAAERFSELQLQAGETGQL